MISRIGKAEYFPVSFADKTVRNSAVTLKKSESYFPI